MFGPSCRGDVAKLFYYPPFESVSGHVGKEGCDSDSVIIQRKWYDPGSCSCVCERVCLFECVCVCLTVSTRLAAASQTGAGLYHPPPSFKGLTL